MLILYKYKGARIGSCNKEIIKQQLKSIAKPGINATAFKMVSSPSQIEKQTVIWRTDATNDYLKICFKDDFDGMPSKIMRETIAKMFLPATLPPTSASPPGACRHRLRHCVIIHSLFFLTLLGSVAKLCQ